MKNRLKILPFMKTQKCFFNLGYFKMSNQIQIVPEKSQAALELTPDVIKKYLCPGQNPTEPEMKLFMELCRHQKLNPFLREVYLIKYGTAPAQIVVGKEGFLKRANRDPRYKGHAVNCTLGPDGLTATAKVYKEGFTIPVEVEVDFAEYCAKDKQGNPKNLWATKPKTMLKKVALCQALREAFPDSFGGFYSPEEVQAENLPMEPITIDTITKAPEAVSTLKPEPPTTVKDLRQWPEILDKYTPHMADHDLTKESLGAMSLDKFEELRQAIFGG